METTDTATAEQEAVFVINETVEQAQSSDALLRELQKQEQKAEGEKKKQIEEYREGIRPHIHDVMVKDLGDTVGGLYDGSRVTMGKTVLYVRGSVDETLENATETRDHENYHEENDHTAEMISGSSASGETVVTMGAVSFDRESFIEGITVRRTGDTFVSDEYKGFRQKFDRALRASGKTIEQVEEAIDQKDLRLIDDADQKVPLTQAA